MRRVYQGSTLHSIFFFFFCFSIFFSFFYFFLFYYNFIVSVIYIYRYFNMSMSTIVSRFNTITAFTFPVLAICLACCFLSSFLFKQDCDANVQIKLLQMYVYICVCIYICVCLYIHSSFDDVYLWIII